MVYDKSIPIYILGGILCHHAKMDMGSCQQSYKKR